MSAEGPRDSLDIRFRSVLFFVLYNLMGMAHSLLSLLVAPLLSFPQRYRFVNHWTRATMWLLRNLNGIHIEVIGAHNIPKDRPVVVLANHQSQWETFYLQLLVCPQSTVLKRELLWVPFFGWGLALLRPIPINRKKPTTALKAILRHGRARLEQGINVMVFPEGTRQPPGTLGPFNSGGAMLAVQSERAVLPIVHNSGDCWPARSMMRLPGTIRVIIGAPIETRAKTARQVNQEVQRWMHEHYPVAVPDLSLEDPSSIP